MGKKNDTRALELILEMLSKPDGEKPTRKDMQQAQNLLESALQIMRDAAAPLFHRNADLTESLFLAMSWAGKRAIAEDVLEVQDAPWFKLIREAEREARRREIDIRREAKPKP